MSALGHKQTYALQQAMSALPPIATDRTSANRHVRFTPESGHVQRTTGCLLRAKSGHSEANVRARYLLERDSFDVAQGA
jgi:hypothetical protein